MKHSSSSCSLLGCLLLGVAATGQEPDAELTPSPRAGAVFLLTGQEKKDPKDKKEDKTAQPPVTDAFGAGPSERAEAPSRFNPHMMGDFPGMYRQITVNVLVTPRITVQNPALGTTVTFIDKPILVGVPIRVPIASRGGFKLADNASVMPQDRASFTYNYYNNEQGPANGSDTPQTVQQMITFNGLPAVRTFTIPGVSPPIVDQNRETIGFEKSFLDGAFSFGVRVPLFQQNGADAFHADGVGDVTFMAKAALWRDRESGSGLCAGLAVTAPTGPDIVTADGNIHSTLLQPFMGYQLNWQNWRLFGFTSVAMPTDDRDVTLLFNDIGLGFQVFEGTGFLRAVVPAIEAHVTTPLDHRQTTDTIQGIDLVVLTGGVHLGLGSRSTLTLGVAAPVSGPRPFDVEAIVQFNFRF